MHPPLSDSVSDYTEWNDLTFQMQIPSPGQDKSKLGPRSVEVKCDGNADLMRFPLQQGDGTADVSGRNLS